MRGSLENPDKWATIGGRRFPDAPVGWAKPGARGGTAITRSPFHHFIFITLLRRHVVMGNSFENLWPGSAGILPARSLSLTSWYAQC